MLHFSYGGVSHVGLVREHNEDAGFAGAYLQLVADGVGGAAAGEVASATTTYVVTALAMGRPDQDGASLLAEAVATAHRELRRGIDDDHDREGMATTLTALLIRDDQVTLAHVGDSRAYLLRSGELTRLSTDHTLVQLLVDRGELTPEQVADPSLPQRRAALGERRRAGQAGPASSSTSSPVTACCCAATASPTWWPRPSSPMH